MAEKRKGRGGGRKEKKKKKKKSCAKKRKNEKNAVINQKEGAGTLPHVAGLSLTIWTLQFSHRRFKDQFVPVKCATL